MRSAADFSEAERSELDLLFAANMYAVAGMSDEIMERLRKNNPQLTRRDLTSITPRQNTHTPQL